MKKSILTTFLLLTIYTAFSQYDNRPSRSRFWNSRYSTFGIEPGDILLYTVSKADSQYNYIVTVKKFGNDIAFDYAIPEKASSGNVQIPAICLSNAFKYDTVTNSGDKSLTDQSVLWLSQKNYDDLFTARETYMDIGNGKENFQRKTISTQKINYKGKEKIITICNFESNGDKGKADFAVLTNEKNPLIIKMDSDWKLTLKEVR